MCGWVRLFLFRIELYQVRDSVCLLTLRQTQTPPSFGSGILVRSRSSTAGLALVSRKSYTQRTSYIFETFHSFQTLPWDASVKTLNIVGQGVWYEKFQVHNTK